MLLKQKRHLCLFAAAWIFGTVIYCRKEDIWLPVLIILGLILLYGIVSGEKRRERIVVALIVPALILTAVLICGYRDQSSRRIAEMLETAPGTELSGVVCKKEIRSDQCLYYLNTSLKKVIVYFETDDIPIGSEVNVKGKWQSFSAATNEGSFDYAEYYREQNISFRIYADDIAAVSVPKVSFREGLYRLQKRISTVFADSLNPEEAGIMSTLTVGSRGLLDPDVKQMYQDAGISHILAISGLHISILGFGLYRFLRKIRVPCHVSEAMGCGIILCFVLMTGAGVSALRALVMYLLLMGARATGRTYDPLNALALAALVLLVPNPLNLYRSGFQFSFMAMAAIVLFNAVTEKAARGREAAAREGEKAAPGREAVAKGREKAAREGEKTAPGRDVTAREGEKAAKGQEAAAKGQEAAAREREAAGSMPLPMPEPAVEDEPGILKQFAVSLRGRLLFGAFLQAAMLPLTAWYYYEVPLYATFLNLLILPLCSALLGFGLAGGILGIIFPQAARWFLVPCHVILRIYAGAIKVINRLPLHQWITGQPPAWLLLIFYVVLAGACLLYLAGPQGSLLPVGKTAMSKSRSLLSRICNFLICNFLKQHREISFIVPAALLACILFVPERQVCRIDFLDVGQGDGIFLTDGAGTRVMIDGGSSSESSVGTYEIEPFLKYHGIRRIDAWILTHGDSDHYSGLLEILEDGYSVDYLVLAEAMPRDETWERLASAAEENGTEVVYVTAGDEIALRDCSMTCLYPAEEEGTGAAADEKGTGAAADEKGTGAAADEKGTGAAADEIGTGAAGDGGMKISVEDANEFSQVWLFEKGDMSVLFTGDLGEDQEQALIERGVLPDCTILKVAHHGSKYSSCAEFLKAVSPEYAVISCGKNNIYGHPAPETLDRLADAGCEIYRTPQCGQITVYEKRGRWRLHTYLQ